MFVSLILTLHLTGAAMTLAVVVGGLYSLFHNRGIKNWRVALYLVAFFQLLTGTVLFIAAPGSSLSGSCLRGLVYLSVVSFVQIRWSRQAT